MSARYASYLNAFLSLLYCHIIFFAPNSGVDAPVPVGNPGSATVDIHIAPTECCVLLPPILHRPPSGRFRIPLGGGGGGTNSESGVILQFFAENCMKMKEFGPRGGASLAPPWIRQCHGRLLGT